MQEDVSRYAMLASTVSSKMLAAMATKEGFTFRETLTGFKWLGNEAQRLQEAGCVPLFAFEEAIGFMFYSVVRVSVSFLSSKSRVVFMHCVQRLVIDASKLPT